jgi:hypothetical protein
MRRAFLSPCLAIFAVALFSPLPSRGAPAFEEPWGTIKGRVVWAEMKLPEVNEITINKDADAITAALKGEKLLAENWVVNKDNKGVRWVYVWLAPEPPKEVGGKPVPLPIHPDLKEINNKEVVIDMPRGRFEPHAVALRVGQTLIGDNTSHIAYNFKLDGGPDYVGGNVLLPAEKRHEFSGLKASKRPIVVLDSIHAWMRGWVRVFDHPYFAITDADGKFEIKNAPAGTFRLFIWHEETGWINKGGKDGEPITIKPGQKKDLGEVDVKNP